MKYKPTRPDSNRSILREAPLFFGRHPDLSEQAFEAFLESVRAFESALTTTLARLLIHDGLELPSPDSFTEESVHGKLWEVIRGMARHHHFLYSTDHLSDLELYRNLWEKTLNDPAEEITPEMGDCAWHIDFVGDGSEESIRVWLRHYATGVDRQHWAMDFPDDAMPEHVDPPCDRDRHLPQR